MEIFSAEFKKACSDYRYLCNRGYSFRQAVRFTGDRYRLNSVQRSVLLRGIMPDKTADSRRLKLLEPGEISGLSVAVDGCNIIATLGNYLSGHFVYIAADGIVRDAAESGGVFRNDLCRKRAAGLIADEMKLLNPGLISFYIDEPHTHSRDLAREITEAFSAAELDFTVTPVRSADRVLKCLSGVIITGDSEIIDASDGVFDLSAVILKNNLGAGLPDITFHLKTE